MKILHIIPSLAKGGAERLVIDIVIALNEHSGIEARLLVLEENIQYDISHVKKYLDIVPAGISLSLYKKNNLNINALHRYISSFNPDVIHTHLFSAEIVSRSINFPSAKYFSHCHDNMPQLRNLSLKTLFKKKYLTDFYEKQYLISRYLKCNNKFIAISNDAKQYFEKVLPPKLKQNIFLLSNAIDFNRFNAIAHERSLVQIRLVNTGSFVPKKNQQFLIDVVNELAKRKADVKLTLLGDGYLLDGVRKKISDYNLQDFIECKGNVERVEDYLAAANIYVHSATYEPFGLVLLEAMAAGLPVVCLDGGGNRDIIEQNKNGIMIYEQNAEAFADAILKIANDEKLYRKMSDYAVEYAKQFDIKSYADKLLELYKS